MALNVGTKYIFSNHKDAANDPKPEQVIICPLSKVTKALQNLTDADIEKMIKKGNKDFKPRPVADLSAKKA